jgi:trigger factor
VQHIKNLKINKLPKSEVEITGEIDAEYFGSFWEKAVKDVSQNVKIDGFRSGNIPEAILLKTVGEAAILEEAAEQALKKVYPEILVENKVAAIDRPEISITKIAKGNPLGFSMKVPVLPEFDLPTSYKKIAKDISTKTKTTKDEVTEKEIDDLITQIRKSRAPHIHDPKETKGSEKDGDKEHADLPLPEFNDEFVKSLGKFEGVEDFKTKIRANLLEEKAMKRKEDARMEVLETISKEVKIDIPQVLLEAELDKMVSELTGRLEQYGIKFDDYLKNTKKTEVDIRKESAEIAGQRVKYNLILKKIAKEENIAPLQEEVDLEVQKILDYYKGADPDSAKVYILNVLTNEKTLNYLENIE